MITIRLVIYVYLCVGITLKTQGATEEADDLVDEYYTTILQTTNTIIPQDEKDAQTIVEKNREEKVIAGILAYRNKTRRFAIQQVMLTKINPTTTYSYGHHSYTKRYWITTWYPPQRDGNYTYTFMDLCFGLLKDENIVLGQYLRNFFDAKDENWITIGMVLTKDMHGMISTYDENHQSISFKEERNSQREPYVNMLRSWVKQNRDPIESGDPNSDDVAKDAKALKEEHDKGHWHQKCRDQLELILMYKSIKYARAVLKEFKSIMCNKTMDTVINDCINNETKMNPDLADAYSSLAKYINDKYSYIAEILYNHKDGKDHWAAWILSIAVLRPNEWKKVDLAFQTNYKAGSLTKFIMQNLTTDKIMAEMIAVIIDPDFKPTTFSGSVDGGGQEGPKPPAVPPTKPDPGQGPPPVPPTVPAPAPPPPP